MTNDKGQMTTPLDWPHFLAAPAGEVARIAPATAVFSAGGTRRAAALAGISAQSEAYVQWAREQNRATFELLFQHGVCHVLAAAITQNQLQETTPIYRERLLQWTAWGMSGREALADYARLGWKVRLLGTEDVPELQACAAELEGSTAAHSDHTVWWFVSPTPESHWQQLLQAAHRTHATTRADLLMALYGEAIPPATLFIGYGKPLLMPELVPPLLMGSPMHCYWLQRPGYLTDPTTLREILYDFAYLRDTWQADKTERAASALAQPALWQHTTLGLGERVGAFWVPR